MVRNYYRLCLDFKRWFFLDFVKKNFSYKTQNSAVSTLVPTIMPNIVGPLSDALAVVSMSLGTVQLARHLQLHPKSMEFFKDIISGASSLEDIESKTVKNSLESKLQIKSTCSIRIYLKC